MSLDLLRALSDISMSIIGLEIIRKMEAAPSVIVQVHIGLLMELLIGSRRKEDMDLLYQGTVESV